MRNRVVSVLTTWPFLVSLALLLLNDWCFKSAFPGFVTGKLSDFAGIALVALLLLSVWPQSRNYRNYVCAGISFAFLWWKSPLSDSFIMLINGAIPFQIGRTVDYTDLMALAILPACRSVVQDCAAFSVGSPSLRRVVLAPIAALTLFSILGTSVIATRQDYSVRAIDPAVQLRREAVAEAINEVAAKHGLKCKEDCSSRADTGTYQGNGMYMTYKLLSDRAVSFSVEAYPDGLFFGTSGAAKGEALRASLKHALAERFPSLEYVELLHKR